MNIATTAARLESTNNDADDEDEDEKNIEDERNITSDSNHDVNFHTLDNFEELLTFSLQRSKVISVSPSSPMSAAYTELTLLKVAPALSHEVPDGPETQ